MCIRDSGEIVELEPDYRQAANLLKKAGSVLEKRQKEERLSVLYQQGLRHLVVEEWQEAFDCLDRVHQENKDYQDVARCLAEAKRGIRRTNSIFYKLLSRLKADKG